MRVVGLLNAKGHHVHAIDERTCLAEAATIMQRHNIGSLVVLGEDGTFAGLLTERDVVAALAARPAEVASVTAVEVMRTDVPTCALSETLESVMTVMTNQRARHLPVIEDGQLVGVLSIGDVVKRRLEELVEETQLIQSYATWGR
jgi:CBS domain-containing protein